MWWSFEVLDWLPLLRWLAGVWVRVSLVDRVVGRENCGLAENSKLKSSDLADVWRHPGHNLAVSWNARLICSFWNKNSGSLLAKKGLFEGTVFFYSYSTVTCSSFRSTHRHHSNSRADSSYPIRQRYTISALCDTLRLVQDRKYISCRANTGFTSKKQDTQDTYTWHTQASEISDKLRSAEKNSKKM